MALTKAIEKVDVRESSGNKMITLRLTISDDAVEVFSQDYRVDYKPGTDLPAEVQKLQKKMQADADKVVAARVIYNHAQLDTAVTWLNNNVTVE